MVQEWKKKKKQCEYGTPRKSWRSTKNCVGSVAGNGEVQMRCGRDLGNRQSFQYIVGTLSMHEGYSSKDVWQIRCRLSQPSFVARNGQFWSSES